MLNNITAVRKTGWERGEVEGRKTFIPRYLESFSFDFLFTAILARGDTVTVAGAQKAQVPSSLAS